jgi:hypothetical protein
MKLGLARLLLVCGIAWLGLSAASAHAADCDGDPGLIVPGKCVGPIPASVTFATVKQVLVGHVVKPAIFSDEEGPSSCATVIDPGTRAEAYILWVKNPDQAFDDLSPDQTDPEKACGAVDFGEAKAESVLIGPGNGVWPQPYAGSDMIWHTTEGIKPGLDLSTLRKLIHEPFSVVGFDSDYGGRIDLGLLRLQTELDQARWQGLTEQQLDSISGDRNIDAGDPVLDLLNPKVTGLFVAMTIPHER